MRRRSCMRPRWAARWSAAPRSRRPTSWLSWTRSRPALQFDGVALGVLHVERKAVAVGAVAASLVDDGHAVGGQMRADRGLAKRPDLQGEVVEVAPLGGGAGAAQHAQRSVQGDE